MSFLGRQREISKSGCPPCAKQSRPLPDLATGYQTQSVSGEHQAGAQSAWAGAAHGSNAAGPPGVPRDEH